MQPDSAPWYKRSTFWSIVVSVVAIVLTQLAPLKTYLFKGEVKFKVVDKVRLTHRLGIPNALVNIDFRNVGYQTCRVNQINLRFFRDGKELPSIPVRNIFEQNTASVSVPLAQVTLGAGGEFLRTYVAFPQEGRDLLRELRALTSEVERDIRGKVLAARELHGKRDLELVEVDPKYVARARAMLDSNFIWHPGEYVMEVVPTISECPQVESQRVRFTVFESDATDLKVSFTDEYKYGIGISQTESRLVWGVAVETEPIENKKQ